MYSEYEVDSTTKPPCPLKGGVPAGSVVPPFRGLGGLLKTYLSPSCHPLSPSNRVQTLCSRTFCHPDTLFSKKTVISPLPRAGHHHYFYNAKEIIIHCTDKPFALSYG